MTGPHPKSDETAGPAFVLHEHHKPQHHFDLRLEWDGVLKSWALPKGMPASTRQDRLAVAVSDHDLDHLTYEDADKSIADIGWWELLAANDKRLVFGLQGTAGAGRYALIDTGRDWLLPRTPGSPASWPGRVS